MRKGEKKGSGRFKGERNWGLRRTALGLAFVAATCVAWFAAACSGEDGSGEEGEGEEGDENVLHPGCCRCWLEGRLEF